MQTASAADLAAAPPSAPAIALAPWTVQFNSEVRYFDLSGSRGDPAVTPAGTPATGGHATQVYTPTTLSISGMLNDQVRLESSIRAGYVSTHQTTAGVMGGVGTPTDTVPSLTLTYLGMDNIQPFASLNLNLPTGQSALYGFSSNARLDPDLVDVPTFGEGFNVGPTLGANIPLSTNVVATISGGFTSRGDYRQDGLFTPGFPQPTVNVHPGDLATFNASVSGQDDKFSYQVSASYVHSGKSQNNDVDQLQTGQQVSLSGVLGYAFTDALSIRAIPSFSYTTLDRVQSPPLGALALELSNTNSAIVSIRIEPTYKVDKFSIGPIGAFQYRDANAYDITTLQFVPAKTRESGGAQATYTINDKAMLNSRFEHVWTHVDDTLLGAGLPGIARDAWVGVVGGTLTF